MNKEEAFSELFNKTSDALSKSIISTIKLQTAIDDLLKELNHATAADPDASTLAKRDTMIAMKVRAAAVSKIISAANETLWHS